MTKSQDYKDGLRAGWRIAQRHYDKMLEAQQNDYEHEIEVLVRQLKAQSNLVAESATTLKERIK